MLSVFMMSVAFYTLLCWMPLCCVSVCRVLRFIHYYAGSHYAECHYAECRYADSCYADSCYAECHYAECRYADCCYAESQFPECRYAECRDTLRQFTNVAHCRRFQFEKDMIFLLKMRSPSNSKLVCKRALTDFWKLAEALPGHGGVPAGDPGTNVIKLFGDTKYRSWSANYKSNLQHRSVWAHCPHSPLVIITRVLLKIPLILS
jgi:hypothetical protein